MVLGKLLLAVPITGLAAVYFRNSLATYVFGANVAALVALVAFKVLTAKSRPPISGPVKAGKTRICVAGYEVSPPTGKAHELAALIAAKDPAHYESWYYFDTFAYFHFLKEKFDPVPFPAHLKGHATSPFVWLETAPTTPGGGNVIVPIGGSGHFSKWAVERFTDKEVLARANKVPSFADFNHSGKNKATA